MEIYFSNSFEPSKELECNTVNICSMFDSTQVLEDDCGLITLENESYYINSRLESRSLREQIRCFYYILGTFCINIHFS